MVTSNYADASMKVIVIKMLAYLSKEFVAVADLVLVGEFVRMLLTYSHQNKRVSIRLCVIEKVKKVKTAKHACTRLFRSNLEQITVLRVSVRLRK